MHQIVLFIEPNEHEYQTPFKIGNKFMNLCAIDEDAGFEIVKVLKLEKIRKPNYNWRSDIWSALEERKGKGIAINKIQGRHDLEIRKAIMYPDL